MASLKRGFRKSFRRTTQQLFEKLNLSEKAEDSELNEQLEYFKSNKIIARSIWNYVLSQRKAVVSSADGDQKLYGALKDAICSAQVKASQGLTIYALKKNISDVYSQYSAFLDSSLIQPLTTILNGVPSLQASIDNCEKKRLDYTGIRRTVSLYENRTNRQADKVADLQKARELYQKLSIDTIMELKSFNKSVVLVVCNNSQLRTKGNAFLSDLAKAKLAMFDVLRTACEEEIISKSTDFNNIKKSWIKLKTEVNIVDVYPRALTQQTLATANVLKDAIAKVNMNAIYKESEIQCMESYMGSYRRMLSSYSTDLYVLIPDISNLIASVVSVVDYTGTLVTQTDLVKSRKKKPKPNSYILEQIDFAHQEQRKVAKKIIAKLVQVEDKHMKALSKRIGSNKGSFI